MTYETAKFGEEGTTVTPLFATVTAGQAQLYPRLVAMLKRLEWGDKNDDHRLEFHRCPVCEWYHDGEALHASDCELAQLLKEANAET